MKCEDFCGGKNSRGMLYHFWTLIIIIDTVAKNLWFNSHLIVEGQKAPGLTVLPAVTLSVGAAGLCYFTELLMEEDDYYWKKMVYHSLNFMLFLACVTMAIDGGLFLMDKEYFCQLQKEPVMKECEKRNEYLVRSMIAFYLLGLPIIWQMN